MHCPQNALSTKCRMQKLKAPPSQCLFSQSCISLPVEQHMPERSTMPLGVGCDGCQSSHMVMHLVWQHNVAEVLFDFVTGLASLGSSLPEPAAGGVTNQFGRAQPPVQASPVVGTLLNKMNYSKQARCCRCTRQPPGWNSSSAQVACQHMTASVILVRCPCLSLAGTTL